MRYRVTIRGDKTELRGYVTSPTDAALAYAAQAAVPLGMFIASPVPEDYNPFRKLASDDAWLNLVSHTLYQYDQGTMTVRDVAAALETPPPVSEVQAMIDKLRDHATVIPWLATAADLLEGKTP